MFEKVKTYIEEMDKNDLLYLYKEYCNKCDCYDDEIFTIDEFFDDILYGEKDLYNVACRVYYGDFNPAADYIKFNGYGNYQSIFGYELTDYIDIGEMADYIVDNNDPLNNDDIAELLEETEETEEEQ